MSHWCSVHPRYEARPRQRIPYCYRCNELYILRNPEWLYAAWSELMGRLEKRRERKAGKAVTDFARLDVVD